MAKRKRELSGTKKVGLGHLPAEVRAAKRAERERLRKLAETLRDD